VNTKLAKWASSSLVAIGVVLVGAFFLSWVRDWGDGGTSGWDIARSGKHWLYVIPAAGLLLAATAGTHSKHARLLALAVGLLVVGDFAYHVLRGIIQSNLQTWLLLGGAAVMLAGASPERRALRAIGGVSVLLAFFSPWESRAMITVSIDFADLFSLLGVAMILVYGSMLAAVVAIVSAFTTKPWGKTAATVAGISVFVAYFWLLLTIANLFLGWGAWLTLGGCAGALAIALLAPREQAAQPAKV
jgi:hypothetical protein